MKFLAGIAGELAAAQRDSAGRDIEAGIMRIVGQRELRTIAATEFHDTADRLFRNKMIEGFRLEARQLAVGADAGIAALPVTLLPIGR